MLLLLQRRGRLTVAEAATELEVSERTARRDLEALGMAGLPVYSTRGRNGGWALLGGGRTDLSGLSESEVRTLFLLAGPSASATPELRAGLRKLVRALPESFRATAEAATRAVVVDRAGWDQEGHQRPDPPHLDAVQQAVVEGRQATLAYVARDGSDTTRKVHPLGLAVKGSVWYLVAGTDKGQRTFRVDRIRSVELCEEKVLRPPSFDIAEAWRLIAADLEEVRAPVSARAMVDPDLLSMLRWRFARRLRIGPAGTDGRVEVELRSSSARALAGEIAGFAGALEVIEPADIRRLLAEIGRELAGLYVDPLAAPPVKAGRGRISDDPSVRGATVRPRPRAIH
jgi:predicted DNA-binding transcriptional regulator YafY